MDFRFTPEQEAFRTEFLSWLEMNYPDNYDPSKRSNYQEWEDWANAYKVFQRRLFDAGFAAMHYPKEFGGQGKTLEWR